MKSKKAQGLPMESVILAIIVIVVLIIIVVFFLGGTSAIAQKIRNIFTGATSGTDLQTAQQFCQEYCDQERYTSWCNKNFKIDMDADGNAEKNQNTGEYYKYYCGNPTQGGATEPNANSLGLSCSAAGEKIAACNGKVLVSA